MALEDAEVTPVGDRRQETQHPFSAIVESTPDDGRTRERFGACPTHRRFRAAPSSRRPVARSQPDGDLLGSPHHPGLLRCFDARHVVRAAPQRREGRRRRTGTRQALVEGLGGLVRYRRRLRHDLGLRVGSPMARPNGTVRRRCWPRLHPGRHLVLCRSDLPRHLRLRLGSTTDKDPPVLALADDHLRNDRHVLRDVGELVDERPDRIRHRQWPGRQHQPVGGHLQRRGVPPVPAHAAGRLHGCRFHHGVGVFGRLAPWQA